jgi:adenylate cyclase 8
MYEKLMGIHSYPRTYMAASGLNPKHRPSLGGSNEDSVCEIVEFAIAMRQKLQEVNMDAFNTFQLRVGISSGPLISGVIGARKPIFDIWGNTGEFSIYWKDFSFYPRSNLFK